VFPEPECPGVRSEQDTTPRADLGVYFMEPADGPIIEVVRHIDYTCVRVAMPETLNWIVSVFPSVAVTSAGASSSRQKQSTFPADS